MKGVILPILALEMVVEMTLIATVTITITIIRMLIIRKV